MGDGILHDESLDPLGMRHDHAKADWPAVVLHVECVPGQREAFSKMRYDLGDMIERIREISRAWPAAVSEAGVVRGDEVKVLGKPGQ